MNKVLKTSKLDPLLILRGILAISVIVWHISSASGMQGLLYIPGRTAVWMFFGISGYVISYGFLTKRYLLNAHDLKTFYIKRFLRIYPLFLFISVITILTDYLVTGNFLISIKDIPSQIFMLQFNHEYRLSGVFWTLGIEVQFYLIAPLLAAVLLYKLRNELWVYISIYFLMILWLPFGFYFFDWSFDGRNLISNLSHFFIGMLACKLVLDGKQIKVNSYFLIVFIVMILLLTNYLYDYFIKFYWSLGVILIDFSIILAVLLHTNIKEKTIQISNWVLNIFSFFGVISYGIYAWHTYLLKYITLLQNNILLTIITTVFIAGMSYRFIEQPILKSKKNTLF